MSTAHNFFWCDKCPTRVNVQTESSEPSVDAYEGEPCPLCDGGVLQSWDWLVMTGCIPYSKTKGDEAEIHAQWLAGGYDREATKEENDRARSR